jgi:hypothetical protein
VLVVRAVRRRPPPQPAGAWQQPPAQQPWGQPGYGQQAPPQWPQQPGYGQQAPPQWPQQPQQPQQPGPAAPPEREPPPQDRDQGPVPPP